MKMTTKTCGFMLIIFVIIACNRNKNSSTANEKYSQINDSVNIEFRGVPFKLGTNQANILSEFDDLQEGYSLSADDCDSISQLLFSKKDTIYASFIFFNKKLVSFYVRHLELQQFEVKINGLIIKDSNQDIESQNYNCNYKKDSVFAIHSIISNTFNPFQYKKCIAVFDEIFEEGKKIKG